MAEEIKKEAVQRAPRVINKAGGARMRDDRRRNAGGRIAEAPKEFEEITISIDRVARVVKGGRRFRFKALVVVGNKKNKVGVGVAKGIDVTAAVTKASNKAKKNLITFALDKETIPHEIQTKVTGAVVLMKPAAPGTGVIAGGTVRSIVGLTGVKNLISKSLGSSNKVNVAYATIEGLKNLVPKKDWLNTSKPSKKEDK